jgi:hypothetical protein
VGVEVQGVVMQSSQARQATDSIIPHKHSTTVDCSPCMSGCRYVLGSAYVCREGKVVLLV